MALQNFNYWSFNVSHQNQNQGLSNQGDSLEIDISSPIKPGELEVVILTGDFGGNTEFVWTAKYGDILLNGKDVKGHHIDVDRVHYKAAFDRTYTQDTIKVIVYPSLRYTEKTFSINRASTKKELRLLQFAKDNPIVATIVGAILSGLFLIGSVYLRNYLDTVRSITSPPTTPPTTPVNPFPTKNVVEGRVINGETGKGVQTKITLKIKDTVSIIDSDLEGKFQFLRKPNTEVNITIDADGYEKCEVLITPLSNQIGDIKLQPKGISQQEAKYAVEQWLAAKPEIYGKYSDPDSPAIQDLVHSVATSYLANDTLRYRGSISDLKRAGHYWYFMGHSKIDPDFELKQKGYNRAEAQMTITETRYLRDRRSDVVVEEVDGAKIRNGKNTDKYIYLLAKQNGITKICWYYDLENLGRRDYEAIQQCLKNPP